MSILHTLQNAQKSAVTIVERSVEIIAFCTRPLKAVREGSGKVHILDRSAFNEYKKSGRLRDIGLQSQDFLRGRYGDSIIFDVPCGHCINCRLNYAKKWSQRCLLESRSWSENYFVTLTYDDQNLPIICDPSTFEVLGATLVPKDVVTFIKCLREKYRERFNHVGIRFYMAGEYGDMSFRPHYHLILFNLPIPDLVYYCKSPLGDVYYNSDFLSDAWKKGHVVIGEVTPESAAYVARYCQKKATKSIDYESLGLAKEYTNMSRRPGIALPYLEQNVGKIYEDDLIYLPNGQTCHPMRYFDSHAESLGIDLDAIKQKRIATASLINNERVDEVSRDFYKYLDDLEESYLKRSKALTRYL